MKKLKSILSVTLISVLIAATAGFSVSRHYCLGMLVSENYYGFADKCGSYGESDDCEQEGEWFSSDCCEDEFLVVEGIEILSTSKKQLSPQIAPAAVPAPEFSQLVYTPAEDIHQLHPSPPPLPLSGKEILVWEQRFLI